MPCRSLYRLPLVHMTDEKDRGFKISDHRKFNPDGTPRDQGTEKPAESSVDVEEQSPGRVLNFPGEAAKRKDAPAADLSASATRPVPGPGNQSGGEPGSDPAFDELINMLTVEAVMHLGLIENPMQGGVSVDLEAARHMIDMLGMIQHKTQGNLTPDERLLIDNVLADLRMQFVGASKGR